MAGDWIKIEENMPDKPEVCQMAARLGIDADAVAGKLLRVWAWAGRNCNADGVTNVTVRALLDRLSGVTGFADAMASVGWLHLSDDSLAFPKFDRHCSQTAKERANTNRRVAKYRSGSNADTVTSVTLEPLPKPLPEKRREREEKSIPKTEAASVDAAASVEVPFSLDGAAPTAATRPPAKQKAQPSPELTDGQWLESLAADPTYQGINVQIEYGKMCRWCEQRRKQPSRRRLINWLNGCERPMAGVKAEDIPQRRATFA